MATSEGSCHCDCYHCSEGTHCDNPDTGCFVTTGSDTIDPLDIVSEAERIALKAELKKETAQFKLWSDW